MDISPMIQNVFIFLTGMASMGAFMSFLFGQNAIVRSMDYFYKRKNGKGNGELLRVRGVMRNKGSVKTTILKLNGYVTFQDEYGFDTRLSFDEIIPSPNGLQIRITLSDRYHVFAGKRVIQELSSVGRSFIVPQHNNLAANDSVLLINLARSRLFLLWIWVDHINPSANEVEVMFYNG